MSRPVNRGGFGTSGAPQSAHARIVTQAPFARACVLEEGSYLANSCVLDLAAEEELRDSGRVVIRYSGTEALARVMIEAESEDAMRRHAEAIASAIRAELGV
jgi:phosphomannomutase